MITLADAQKEKNKVIQLNKKLKKDDDIKYIWNDEKNKI
jgi:hypothetical protein